MEKKGNGEDMEYFEKKGTGRREDSGAEGRWRHAGKTWIGTRESAPGYTVSCKLRETLRGRGRGKEAEEEDKEKTEGGENKKGEGTEGQAKEKRNGRRGREREEGGRLRRRRLR